MTSSAAAASATTGSTWVQTDPLTLNHTVTAAERVYEEISEVPALTIPFPGVWELSYSARTYIGSPPSTAPLYATTAVFSNGVLVPGTEAVTGGYIKPNEAFQDTIGQTFLHKFAVGDEVTLHAYRIGQGGTIGIFSNTDGRTRITARWVAPGF